MIEIVKPIDSETIYDGASWYYDKHRQLCNISLAWYNSLRCFANGAKWIIKAIWHDIDKKPIENYTLIIIKSDTTLNEIHYNDTNNWEDFVKDNDIKIWCYKQDLFFKDLNDKDDEED